MKNNHGNSCQLCISLSEHPPQHLQHQMLLFRDLLVNGFYKKPAGRRITQPSQSCLGAHVCAPRQMRGEAGFPPRGCWGVRREARGSQTERCSVPPSCLKYRVKPFQKGIQHLREVVSRWERSFPEARSTQHSPQRNTIKRIWNYRCSREVA